VVLREVPVELGARHTHVVAEADEGTLARDEVHQRREGEERHDDDVRHRLGGEAEVLGAVVDELAQDRIDDIDGPEHDGRDDREPAHGDLAVARTDVDRG